MDVDPEPPSLTELEAEITLCDACPRLVSWREKVARDKRAAYQDEEYWVGQFRDSGILGRAC